LVHLEERGILLHEPARQTLELAPGDIGALAGPALRRRQGVAAARDPRDALPLGEGHAPRAPVDVEGPLLARARAQARDVVEGRFADLRSDGLERLRNDGRLETGRRDGDVP